MTSINDNKNKSRNKSQQQPLPKDAEGLKQLVTAASAIGEIISLSEKYESVVFDNTSSSSLSSSAPLTHLSNLRAAFSQNPQLATLSCLKPTHAKFCKLGRVRSLRIGQSSTVADLIFVKFVALSNSGKICGPFDGPAYSSALRLILGLDSIVRMDDAADANDNDNDNVDDNGNNNNNNNNDNNNNNNNDNDNDNANENDEFEIGQPVPYWWTTPPTESFLSRLPHATTLELVRRVWDGSIRAVDSVVTTSSKKPPPPGKPPPSRVSTTFDPLPLLSSRFESTCLSALIVESSLPVKTESPILTAYRKIIANCWDVLKWYVDLTSWFEAEGLGTKRTGLDDDSDSDDDGGSDSDSDNTTPTTVTATATATARASRSFTKTETARITLELATIMKNEALAPLSCAIRDVLRTFLRSLTRTINNTTMLTLLTVNDIEAITILTRRAGLALASVDDTQGLTGLMQVEVRRLQSRWVMNVR